jgi:hypothetical protein
MPTPSFMRLVRNLHTSTRLINNTRTASRAFSTSPRYLAADQDSNRHPHPQRDAQLDREKMNPEPNETSKSGTDHESAKNDEAAFDPNITSPEGAMEKAGEGNKVNPLNASPANPDISQGTAEEQGGGDKKISEGGGGRQGGGDAGKGSQSI